MNQSQLGGFPVPVRPTEMRMRYMTLIDNLRGIFSTAGMAVVRASALAAFLMSRPLDSAR